MRVLFPARLYKKCVEMSILRIMEMRCSQSPAWFFGNWACYFKSSQGRYEKKPFALLISGIESVHFEPIFWVEARSYFPWKVLIYSNSLISVLSSIRIKDEDQLRNQHRINLENTWRSSFPYRSQRKNSWGLHRSRHHASIKSKKYKRILPERCLTGSNIYSNK